MNPEDEVQQDEDLMGDGVVPGPHREDGDTEGAVVIDASAPEPAVDDAPTETDDPNAPAPQEAPDAPVPDAPTETTDPTVPGEAPVQVEGPGVPPTEAEPEDEG